MDRGAVQLRRMGGRLLENVLAQLLLEDGERGRQGRPRAVGFYHGATGLVRRLKGQYGGTLVQTAVEARQAQPKAPQFTPGSGWKRTSESACRLNTYRMDPKGDLPIQ